MFSVITCWYNGCVYVRCYKLTSSRPKCSSVSGFEPQDTDC